MRESAYLNFRWTRRTTRTAIYGFIIVPALLYYITDLTNQRWNWNGKRKGQSLSAKAESSP
ncbi:hypothetical protein K443DRAFT_128503 [Laccaria amethystina LaAM-08-1]|uniref:Complex I-B15 n=1 Tax=Laccaria amethystina LaAM-08-1 TaxID=1095629 RepID=A0A0C9YCQ2_9AGAR|nr:hypothetical protein K443DRAFT_128503 [Laccaria amethystina LaAM-08-1]